MKVFVAGATGAIGSRIVRDLVRRGHRVVGTTRTPAKVQTLLALGAEPVLMDALDEANVKAAVVEAEPEVVVHELTALPRELDPRRFAQAFGQTDRLRTDGTDNLMSAAMAVGARRFVAQSYAAWPYERRGGPIKSEDDPLDPDPIPQMRRTLDALRYLEWSVAQADLDGVALRYGAFYGPGTGIGRGGAVLRAVARRRFPIVGTGGGVWSFIHVDDAAAATVAAVEGGSPGVYNVVDDEPATVAEWLPVLAMAIEAPPPRRMPRWLGRLFIGDVGVSLMTEIRGASNVKARRELDWGPAHPTWRRGFLDALD